METSVKKIKSEDLIVIPEEESKKSQVVNYVNEHLVKDPTTGKMTLGVSRKEALKYFTDEIHLSDEAAKTYYYQEVNEKYGRKREESGRAKAIRFALQYPDLNRKSMIANWEKLGIPKATGSSYYKGVMNAVKKNMEENMNTPKSQKG